MWFEGRTWRAPKRSFSPKFLRRHYDLILAGCSLGISICFLATGILRAGPPQTAAGQAGAKQARTSSQKIEFDRDIKPILQSSCVSCHGTETHQGQLRLDSEAAILDGGVSGKVIIPGNSQESLLVMRLLGAGGAPRMPMSGEPLSTEKIALIRAWIDEGSFTTASVSSDIPSGTSATTHDLPPSAQSPAPHPNATGGSVVFATQIRPIFAARCYPCHGLDVQQNGLRLDSLQAILTGSTNGKVVIPGDSQKSHLVRRLLGLERPQMPYGAPPLSAEQIELVRKWVDEGALGPDSVEHFAVAPAPTKHWAYVKPERAAVPKVKNATWCRNPIDNFILASLEKEGLSPSPEADRITLRRRLNLDLVGLPPTIEEVDTFLADKSPAADEKVVDSLLASPHYGERWAQPWLDYARYADSHGYEKDPLRIAWEWRDWLINALNQDMSFKEFTIEQIAGDMLPNPTTQQLVATGFHRNTMLNFEGGVDREEYRWYSLIDRVNTTAAVWLGLTLECAQCHNHKFDPFTQKDFYRMLAFFDNNQHQIIELGQGEGHDQEPEIELPTSEQAARSRVLRNLIAEVQTLLNTQTPELDAAQIEWEAKIKKTDDDWAILRPSHVDSAGGTTLKVLEDESILASGKNPEPETYEIQAETDLSKISGLRIEVLSDPSLPQGGPGRDPEGNFVLSAVEVTEAPADEPQATEKVTFKEAFGNESQSGYNVSTLTQKEEGGGRGWAIDASPSKIPLRRQAVLVPEKPFGYQGRTFLTIRLKQNMRRPARNLGRFRLSVTTIAEPQSTVRIPARVLPVMDTVPAERSRDQKEAASAVFRSVTPLLKAQRDHLVELQKELDKLGIVTAKILREREGFERPWTYVHVRGSFLNKADKVYADVPASLPPLPKEVMPNRLGLAYWLVDENNPLTARVQVNRIWEAIFGRGIVETSENFGTQGTLPSHPELLDWLATEFMRQGWSMKNIVRLIVTSATYRQSSRVTPELLERDPYNKLLARGPRFRAEAETMRDIALAASGLLSPKIGGPSVFPYQPEGIWDRPYSDDEWVMSEGEDRYRRGIYTFIRRTAPYPTLTVLDAPSREFCTIRRVRTNTPLQALTTLNDPAFFEAARALAKKIMLEGGADTSARAIYGFRRCVSRRPSALELNRLLAFYHQQEAHFASDPKAAVEVLKDYANPSFNVADQAAWTLVANVLLSMDETITKE
jgi:mono/diheme cytochrome c family protein